MCPTTSRERFTAKRRTDLAQPTRAAKGGERPRLRKLHPYIMVAGLLALAVAGAFAVRNLWPSDAGQPSGAVGEPAHDEHDDHGDSHHHATAPDGHEDASHDDLDQGDAAWLQLSKQARKNVGLKLLTVELRDFDRTITVPATIVQRPGRSQIRVSAPMTGIVTRTYPIQGEAVAPGQPLFDLRLTHEDLVDVQSRFLQTVEQLEVIKREVARLEEVTSSGAVAGKRLLERQYEQQKTEAMLRAQRQALILHGLSDEQVDEISSSRELLKEVTIRAPQPTAKPASDGAEHLLQVSELQVEQGQQVAAGDPLCVLSDHEELYIEGKAFEEDDQGLNEAANQGLPITAIVEANGGEPAKESHAIGNLKILYVENQVELASRALRFYLRLPNGLLRNELTSDGRRFIAWRYKPGQRVELLVPVERWEDRIVLPIGAVVNDGAESFLFCQRGDRFDRKPVHVEYRDQRWAVIENDGTISPGDVVVAAGAYQMHLALKNKAAGVVDPHAGHEH
jgi:cobalt-zinc-cadmium efflux system membrane fusion protein